MAKTITPTTFNQTVTFGTYCSGTQTIEGDANLLTENIKSDVSIFGIIGSYEGNGDSLNDTEWTQSNITSGSFDALYYANGIWVTSGNGLYYSVSWEPTA